MNTVYPENKGRASSPAPTAVAYAGLRAPFFALRAEVVLHG